MSSHNGHAKKIVFIVPYPVGTAPGQRFRYEQYFDQLRANGFTLIIHSFLDDKTYEVLYQQGKSIVKFFGILKGLFLRILHLADAAKADYVFIFREAAPVGPPVFEWIIAKVLHKKIIYDFDDAIWLTDRKHESFFLRISKWRSKVASICTWSYKVSCGNEYLCAYARQFNQQVVYNPTTIDTEHLHNRELYPVENTNNKITIGWTGSHSTLKYLKLIEPEIIALENKYPNLELLVIADKAPELQLKNLTFVPWSFETEITALMKSHIGVMPLPEDLWANGKCGFKALQYMALEIPAVVSPVGVNAHIVDPGKNGFHATTQQEWISNLDKLISDVHLRQQLGSDGRRKVIEEFSVLSNTKNVLQLFT